MLNVDCWMLNGCAERNVECWVLNVEWLRQSRNVECWMMSVEWWVLNDECWMMSVECCINAFFISHSSLRLCRNHSTFHIPHSTFFYLQLCTPSVASSAVSTLTINWSTVFRVSFFFVSLMIVTVFLKGYTYLFVCLILPVSSVSPAPWSHSLFPSSKLLEVIFFFLRQSSLKS